MLLAQSTGGLEPRLRMVEGKRADVRKLIVEILQSTKDYLRLLGDLTGAFKQPQRNPHDVTFDVYNEFVGVFMQMWQAINPNVERRQVVEALAEMPETTGDFMPFVEAELSGESYLN